jgi:hypothetical protein
LPEPEPPRPFDERELSGQAVEIGPRDPLPLGHAVDAEGGAWLLRDGKSVAVLSKRHGHLVAFGAAGGVDGIDEVLWGAQQPLSTTPTTLVKIEAVASGRALHVVERLQSHDATLHSWLSLRGRVLTIRTQLMAGTQRIAATLGEVWAWSNTPTWVEGHGFIDEGGSFGGRYIGRRSAGLAYAACRRDGRRFVARLSSPHVAGYHRRPATGEDRLELGPGEVSPIRAVQLAWSAHSIGEAASRLDCSRDVTRIDVPEAARTARFIEVAHCEEPTAWRARRERSPEGDAARAIGAPFLRFHGQTPTLLVPGDCARVRLSSPGHADGAWIDPLTPSGWDHPDRAPRAGWLRWQVTDSRGAALPCKIQVVGLGETALPDWGEDTAGASARNYAYSRGSGRRPLPPGRYRVRVQRGFEYSAVERDIEVTEGGVTSLKAVLEQEVATDGFLSADLHVHALPSFDAPTLLEDRVLSLAAVGVEVAVSTDHNAVTDYGPAIDKLGLGDHLASVVGDEVTTDEPLVGHFNVFPLPHPRAPLPWRGATISEIFDAARQASPRGVLQVNHPRMGTIGYFDILHLDRGDVAHWRDGLVPKALDFDAIEIFNGDHYASISSVRDVMKDWFALLDAGLRHTATGNSDSHKIAYQDAGMPRNWIAMPDDTPGSFDERAFRQAIHDGRVVVSSGPFVTLQAGGARVGDEIGAGEVELLVTVDAPSWIDLEAVQLLRRGHPIHGWALKDLANDVHPRFEGRWRVDVAHGDWLIAVVEGRGRMPGFYRSGAHPFAFTNPIFVR